MKLNWNHERWRTRDRLLEYDFSIVPAQPHSAGLSMVYPWENTTLTLLSYQLYEIAKTNGFFGTFETFLSRFGSNDGLIVKGTIDTFPVPGDSTNLYMDSETGIVYYFKSTDETVLPDIAAAIGAVIVGSEGTTTYLYIPIRALLIDDTILNCGDAAEYID